MSKDIKTLVLLDAHAIIHRAYHALPEFLSIKGKPTGALYGLASMLMKIVTDLKPDYIVACYYLPGKTFRHEAYDAYKAGRAKTDDALIMQLKNSRQIFEAFGVPMYDNPGFEADDILGTIVEKMKNLTLNPLLDRERWNIIIASGDMDTMQLIDDKKVQVYTLKKGINDTILYDEEAVVARFGFKPALLPDYKGLRGDASDNIKGIKGIGEKTATCLIQNFGTIEEIYKQIKKDSKAFAAAGCSPRVIELIKKIEKVFIQFEFRSLFPRLKNFFAGNQKFPDYALHHSHSVLEGQDLSGRSEDDSKHNPKISENKLQEASIALWLINSDIPNPQLGDILMFAGKDSFDDAYEYIFNQLKQQKLDKVFEEIEKPIMPAVKEMQDHGILIDKKYLKNL